MLPEVARLEPPSPHVSLFESERLWCSVRAADGSLRRNVGRVNCYRICVCAFAAQTPRLAKPGRRGDGRAAVSDLVESLGEFRHDSRVAARSGRQLAARAMSRPRVSLTVAGTPARSSSALNASIAPREEPS